MPLLRRLAWFVAFGAVILAAFLSVFIGWRMMRADAARQTSEQAETEALPGPGCGNQPFVEEGSNGRLQDSLDDAETTQIDDAANCDDRDQIPAGVERP